MENFEEKLKKLEELSSQIKRSDISLEDALKNFEQGIKLAKGMQKELDQMEGKIQQLMNSPSLDEDVQSSSKKSAKEEKDSCPQLGFFDSTLEINGTRA